MPQVQKQFRTESIGPLVRGIERRQRRLKALREKINAKDLPKLDLRMRCLEESQKALMNDLGCGHNGSFILYLRPRTK